MPEILVIRERDVFTTTLIGNGFTVTNFPTIKTETASDLSTLENFIAQIENFDGIFITSSKAAEIVLAKLNESKKVFSGRFYVLGKRSRDLLGKSAYKIFFNKNATTAETLLKSIPKTELENKRFLFPRGNRSLRVVPETLCSIAEVVETIVYQTTDAETNETESFEIKEKLERGKFCAICFFSPSSVEGFLKKFTGFSQGEIKIAAIGETTAKFIKTNDLRVGFIAPKPTAEDFANSLIEYLRKEH